MSTYILYRSNKLWLKYLKWHFIGYWQTLCNCLISCRKVSLSLGLWPRNLVNVWNPRAALAGNKANHVQPFTSPLFVEHLLCTRKYSSYSNEDKAMNKTSKTSVLMQLTFCAGGTENKRFWAEVARSGKAWIFVCFRFCFFLIIQKGKKGEKKY